MKMRQRLLSPITCLLIAISLLAVCASAATFAAPRLTPSGNEIPENILRIELYLDAPLAAPLDMRHVKLLDAAGSQINDAFLDVPLSGRDGMSVSILMHPGRIKTGVGPNSSIGMALRQGQTVSLEIDDPQLQSPVKKTWMIGPALRQRIDSQQWIIQAPTAGGRKALHVDFRTALDAGAAQLIAVAAPDGRRMAGKFALENGEAGWRFTPSSPWRAGIYELRIHPDMEDPAGNRLCSAFESVEQSTVACGSEVRLKFSVP
ncbi:hypothetical protein [Undibacterium terreum]|uniref:Uncharacterized protein n=1 Tax=Undibacterium terreum TaxID=1224302 RepID=A0A916V0J0_9BURK|nr:hypothetical protein [Undibacterium terreum]GGC99354.1 hypothetical protein GCM10011396_53570 [Undibacterium terreum]